MNPTDIEIHAMHNDQMPDSLELPEIMLFISFRALHQSVRAGQINRDQAHAEKIKLLNEFEKWMMWSKIYQETCKIRVELARMSKEVEQGNCERCKQMMRIFDGRVQLPHGG